MVRWEEMTQVCLASVGNCPKKIQKNDPVENQKRSVRGFWAQTLLNSIFGVVLFRCLN